ncbi:pyruvate dehydrogenase [Polynucleobacter wuianus]|uniref:Pyruvate dehydrogenase n=1 Tax=Polynucleobacter wuianus TaxID=1743168 RepID=A0A191UFX8_9BURK|nr:MULTISPECIES: thiamine pyrophosphate-dependent enzyme [Polynucleobacter]ANI99923.1 pyruvate dehydrogenase [Polynucleobacter wuianus]MBU3552750.1 pyruvate oxidase [Polynucleobacter sp. MWH-Post4-6-1]
MKKNAAQVLVEVLESAGVKHIYGVVGDTLNYVTDELSKSSIEWVHTRHEEVGAFAATADSYMTGNLAGCAGSCGPGTLHLINGVYEAHRARVPLIVIASQIDTMTLGMDMPQEVDYQKVFSDCSVFCEQVYNAEQMRRVAVLACQAAISKKGPAVIILPVDISKAEVEDEIQYSVHFPKSICTPSEDDLNQVAQILAKGKKIGIYAGIGCEGAHDLLVELAKKLKAPIAHTSRAIDIVAYDNPYNVGMTGLLGIHSGFHMMSECETLLLLGADFAWGQFYPQHAKIIQIDREASRLGRRHPIALGLQGDVIPTLEKLIPMLKERSEDQFLNECLEVSKKTQAALKVEEEIGDGKVIHPQYMAKLLSQYADEDALFTADTGTCWVWALRHIKVNGFRKFLMSLRHGTMANSMPMALGLKKAYPDRQVIALCGDGGLAMLMGDLLTINQEDLPIKIVVVNNGALDFVELEMKAEGLLNNYTDLHNPSFAKIAEAVGIKAFEVKNAFELDGIIQEFLAHKGPALLDVYTNRSELVMPPTVDLGNVIGMATYSAKAILNGRITDVKTLMANTLQSAKRELKN